MYTFMCIYIYIYIYMYIYIYIYIFCTDLESRINDSPQREPEEHHSAWKRQILRAVRC